MGDIPLEVLSYIMGYLDFSSRREAALVCRSWYEATLHPSFLKKTKYTFDASILDDERHFNNGKHEFAECLCKSPNLYIVGLDENFNAKYFLDLHNSGMKILGPHVEYLSLKNSNVLEGSLVRILQLCPNLKSLDLSGCNALFMSGDAFAKRSVRTEAARPCLQNVTALTLSSSRFLNDALLCQLFDICPLIESINLSSNNLICNSLGLSKKNSLTFLVLAQLLSLRSSLIKHIDFSRTSIVSDALSMLSITKFLDLQSVVLENCRELTDKGVVDLVSHQPNISYLNLSGSLEIGNPSVAAVCEHLHKLEVLKLRKCSKITSVSVKNLNKLNKLRELDISECHEINMAGLQSGLDGMEQLRVLKLKCCNLSRFNESFFLPLTNNGHSNGANNHHSNGTRPETSQANSFVTSLPSHPAPIFLTYALQHLDIGSSQYVDDATLQAVSMHLVNLQVLKLAWSVSVTDRGLLGIPPERSHVMGVQPTTEDQKLAEFLSGGKYSSNHGHGGLINNPGNEYRRETIDMDETELLQQMEQRGIVRLRKLRQLSLSNCKKLSPFSLLQVFKYKGGAFPYMVALDLGMLSQAVTDDVIKALSTSSRLQSLSLAFCGMINDEGMEGMCRNLRSLECLNISSCDGLTQNTISTLSSHCPWLKELDVSMCRKIKAQNIDDLKDTIPSLLRLHTRYAGGASLDKTL